MFLLLLCITKLRLPFTGFPCPYIGHGRLHLCVNRFLSLTPSHYDLVCYAFILALPFFPLHVTPRLFRFGLSASLVRSAPAFHAWSSEAANNDYFYRLSIPYIGQGQLRQCVNRFLSLTPSHYDLVCYTFTPALPFFPLRVTPRHFRLGLSASLVHSTMLFMLAPRRQPTTLHQAPFRESSSTCEVTCGRLYPLWLYGFFRKLGVPSYTMMKTLTLWIRLRLFGSYWYIRA